MDDGLTVFEAFPEIQNQLYLSLQRVWRDWRAKGIEPADLFDSAFVNPRRLAELIEQSGFNHYAQLLRNVAAGRRNCTREKIVREYVNAIWEGVCDQLRLDCREGIHDLEFVRCVDGMLGRIVRNLLRNPSQAPRRPKGTNPLPDLDTQLGESLL